MITNSINPNNAVASNEPVQQKEEEKNVSKPLSFYQIILIAIATSDTDGSGKLSDEERENLFRLTLELALKDALENNGAAVGSLLAAIAADQDKDGQVDPEELAVLRRLSSVDASKNSPDPTEANNTIDERLGTILALLTNKIGDIKNQPLDLDGDGLVSYEEAQTIIDQVKAGLLSKEELPESVAKQISEELKEFGIDLSAEEALALEIIENLIKIIEDLKAEETDGEKEDKPLNEEQQNLLNDIVRQQSV